MELVNDLVISALNAYNSRRQTRTGTGTMSKSFLDNYPEFRDAIRNFEWSMGNPRAIEDGSNIFMHFEPVGRWTKEGGRTFSAKTYVGSPEERTISSGHLHPLAEKEFTLKTPGIEPSDMERIAEEMLEASVEPMNEIVDHYRSIASELNDISKDLKNETSGPGM